jgi:acetyl-CoA C-acetyltransferase
MVYDGLTSTFDKRHMVEQASFVSRELGISREDQDRWALRSHERAVKAMDGGLFGDEIVAVDGFEADESPRRDTSYEKLSELKPGLRRRGDDDGRQRARRERRARAA